jgi:DNA-binding transcriptional LysR family regulator
MLVDDGVPCIAPSLETHHDICRLSKIIGGLTLALITPICAYHGCYWHCVSSLPLCVVLTCLDYLYSMGGQVINQSNCFNIFDKKLKSIMELNQLQSFVQVAQEGSFTRAAEKLFLTQPALSLQIKALETELGTPLFERRNRQIYLTEVGGIVLQRAKELMGIIEQIHQDIAAYQGVQMGRVQIGTSDTTCLYVLPSLVQVFRRQFPNIDIHLTNKPSDEVAELLKGGLVDFGIVTLPLVDPDLETQRLAWREDVIICHPNHPLAQRVPAGQDTVLPAELGKHTLLLLEEGSTSRSLLDQLFAETGISPQVMDLGSIEVIKRYVEIGLGISIVPKVAVKEEVRTGRLHAIAASWLPLRGVGLVLRRGGYLSPAGRMFVTMLQSEIEAVLA